MGSWEFLKEGAGILKASEFGQPLRDTRLSESEVLVREALQNSMDERRKDTNDQVRFRVERKVLTGESKIAFSSQLNLEKIADRSHNFTDDQNWFGEGGTVLDNLDDEEEPLAVLCLSDFNANGLGGRWNRGRSESDRFYKLVLSIGSSLKQSDTVGKSLGSYGYGKMAFAMCSAIRTIIYYSTFLPDEATKGSTCRAMATGFYPVHIINDVDYAGQAYWGERSDEPRIPRKPLSDSKAHEWIKALGFDERGDKDTGTTIIIPATSIQVSDVVDAVEKWFWPRTLDSDPLRQVAYEFIDDGLEIDGPKPRSNGQIAPYMDCFRNMDPEQEAEGFALRPIAVNPPGQKRKDSGTAVFKALGEDVATETNGDAEDLSNCVALIRDGLVIKYDDTLAHEDKVPVVGVFVPKQEHIGAFVFSEPPAHDNWNSEHTRLKQKFEWGPDFLRLTLQRLKSRVRDYQTELDLTPSSSESSADAFLDKIFGDFFNKKKGQRDEPDPVIRAISINSGQNGRRNTGDGWEDFISYSVGLSEHADIEETSVRVNLTLKALADATGSPGDSIPCRVVDDNGTLIGSGKTVSFEAKVSQDERHHFSAEARVHPNWRTRWSIDAAKSEGEGDA